MQDLEGYPRWYETQRVSFKEDKRKWEELTILLIFMGPLLS
jgi:hypothetical protein